MQLVSESVAISEVDEIHSALQAWIEELEDGLGREPPDAALAPEPPAPVFGQPFSAPFAMLNSETIAAALLTRTGDLVSATTAFSRGRGERWLDKAVVATVAATGAVRFEHVTAEDAGAVLIAYAPASQIASWRLPQALNEAAANCPTGVVLLSTMIGDRFRPLSAACHAYGLTGLQTKVAIVRSASAAFAKPPSSSACLIKPRARRCLKR